MSVKALCHVIFSCLPRGTIIDDMSFVLTATEEVPEELIMVIRSFLVIFQMKLFLFVTSDAWTHLTLFNVGSPHQHLIWKLVSLL